MVAGTHSEFDTNPSQGTIHTHIDTHTYAHTDTHTFTHSFTPTGKLKLTNQDIFSRWEATR